MKKQKYILKRTSAIALSLVMLFSNLDTMLLTSMAMETDATEFSSEIIEEDLPVIDEQSTELFPEGTEDSSELKSYIEKKSSDMEEIAFESNLQDQEMPTDADNVLSENSESISDETILDESILDETILDETISDETPIKEVDTLFDLSSEVIELNIEDNLNSTNMYATKRLIVLSNTSEFNNHNATSVFNYDNLYILTYETEDTCKFAYKQLSEDSTILSVEVDAIMETEENDTTTIESENVPTETDLKKYLDSLTPSKEIKVAILDTGIDTSKFGNIIDLGINLSSSGEENSISDDNGHGTEMAELIMQNINSDYVKLMPIKIANSNGKATVLNTYLGLLKAIENDANIINISMNTIKSNTSQVLEDAISEASNKGIIVIVSAGNNSMDTNKITPANVESAIVVSAIDNTNMSSSYSNYGTTVDYCSYGTYGEKTGTSYAAANVTGIIADLLSKDKTLSILDQYAVDLGDVRKDVYYGNGLLATNMYTDTSIESADTPDSNNILNMPNFQELTDEEINEYIDNSQTHEIGMYLSSLSPSDYSELLSRNTYLSKEITLYDVEEDNGEIHFTDSYIRHFYDICVYDYYVYSQIMEISGTYKGYATNKGYFTISADGINTKVYTRITKYDYTSSTTDGTRDESAEYPHYRIPTSSVNDGQSYDSDGLIKLSIKESDDNKAWIVWTTNTNDNISLTKARFDADSGNINVKFTYSIGVQKKLTCKISKITSNAKFTVNDKTKDDTISYTSGSNSKDVSFTVVSSIYNCGMYYIGWTTDLYSGVTDEWFLDVKGNKITNKNDVPRSNAKITLDVAARPYKQIVQVRYENADGTFTGYSDVINQDYNYGSTVSWSRAADATYKAASTSYTVTGEKTTKITVYRKTYTVSLNKGTGINSISGAGTYRVGAPVTVSATTLSNTSQYTYGWSNWSGTYSSTNKSYSFTMPSNNVSLTANGTQTLNAYTVTCYDYLTDGTYLGSPGSTSRNYGASISGSEWGTSSPYNNAQYTYYYHSCTTVNPVTGNCSVIRYWTRSTNAYTQTNNFYYYHPVNGWIWFNAKSYSQLYGTWYTSTNAGITTPTGYHWSHFNSNGWTVTGNKNDGDGNGHYLPNTYTIVYNGNGNTGGSTASTSHTYDLAANLRTNGFTKTGYSFTGWATSPTGNVAYGNNASVINLTATHNATINLYAKWNINQYTVTYIDVVDSTSGKQLGKTTKKFNYGTAVKGSDLGSDASDNKYYKGYYYVSDTTATVTENGATVYRIFKLRTSTINGNINWEDWNNKNLSRPDNVTLHIIGSDGNTYNFEISGDNSKNTSINAWPYSKEVPKYDSNGNVVTYTVSQEKAISKEEGIAYKDPIVNGYDITNIASTKEGVKPEINVTTSIEWIDNDNQYGFRPNEVTIQLLQNGVVIDEVTSSDNKYTFKNLYKYDEDGELFYYTVKANLVDRYDLKVNNSSALYEKTITYTFQSPTFSVIIPKTVIIDGKTGIGEYTVSVQGNIDDRDFVNVIPDSSFTMENKYLSPTTTTVKQTITSFTNKNNIKDGTTATGIINTNSLAGEWSGSFNFNIYFEFGE